MTSPTYTVLRLTEQYSIPLLHRHAARLGGEALGALQHFRSLAPAPGIFRVSWDGRQLTTLHLPKSRLSEGMPVRALPSPFAGRQGRFAKPAPPNPYDAVRMDGVATLLTSADGAELYESCSATVVAWNGTALVLPPVEAPAVASLAEAAIEAHEQVVRCPVPAAGDWPLLLVNAVVRTCAPSIPGRRPFPPEVRARLEALLAREDA
ncbi:MAG: hypothetical protein JNJ54_13100 [Myxococcaceae bacterium]|nr:hypothetical protein [Myxococcaceae bacterium]